MGISAADGQSTASSSFLCLVLQVGMLTIFRNNGVSIFCLGHVLHLFCNFWQFNKKAAAGHYPIIQKKVDELLSKGAVEPSASGAGFFSSVFVVPKHTGGLQLILNLKQ